jgi:hypothetical protein
MKKKIPLLVSIFTALFLWGCYPHGAEYAEEMDVVLAYHNPDYVFNAKHTYSMPDKIVKITGNLTQGETPEFIPAGTAKLILDKIDANMAAYGWSKVDTTAHPDMLLLPAAWEVTTTYVWYDYWYYWYGGWYYPYYPPVYYSSFTTGTLVMNLVDRTIQGANGNSINQWTGAVNGIMTYTYDAERMNTGIDKAFTISPYLKIN